MWRVAKQLHQALLDEADPAADRDETQDRINGLVRSWTQQHAYAGRPVPSEYTVARLEKAVYDHTFGLGRLQAYVEDDEIENIAVNGCDEVLLTYADGTKVAGPPAADSDEELEEIVRIWAQNQGQGSREFSWSAPFLNLALRDRSRLAAVTAVSARPYLAIRRHRLLDASLGGLVELGTVDSGLAEFLAAAVRARTNIVVTGGTNAGKTTVVRALAADIPAAERIATLESDYELYLHETVRHRDVVAFQAREANSEGVGAVGLYDLIPQVLRMSPRRIIVGEVRDREIIPMLEAMSSGQEGSLCTLHAHGTDEVFNRVLDLAQRGGHQGSEKTILRKFGMAVDLVVHLHHDDRAGVNSRYVAEVLEVQPPQDTEWPTFNMLYVPAGPGGRARPQTTPSPRLMEQLTAAGFDPGLLGPMPGPWRTGQRADGRPVGGRP